jgi:hypothetical protein
MVTVMCSGQRGDGEQGAIGLGSGKRLLDLLWSEDRSALGQRHLRPLRGQRQRSWVDAAEAKPAGGEPVDAADGAERRGDRRLALACCRMSRTRSASSSEVMLSSLRFA